MLQGSWIAGAAAGGDDDDDDDDVRNNNAGAGHDTLDIIAWCW